MTSTKQRLGVAMIGVGMVADTHLLALADLQNKLYLKGVLSSRSDSADAFAQKVLDMSGSKPVCYQSLQELADDPDIGMAIVLTPPNARAEIVNTLVDAKIPILMEKPIERNSESAEKLVARCEAAEVSLGIVFQHRVRDASRQLACMMADDIFGPLGLVEVNVPWWRDQSYYDELGRGTYERDGGGVLISQAIHTLDLMLSIVGPVAEVQAMASSTRFHNMESEDYVSASLVFKNGAVGSIIASTASFPGNAESIQLHFDKAVVLFKSGVLHVNWRHGKTESFGADATTGGGADPMAFTHAWHRDIIEDFADSITLGKPPLLSGRDAMQVHQLIDAMIQSSSSRAAVTL